MRCAPKVERATSVKVRALVTDRVHGNELYLPIHHEKPSMNRLTGNAHDPDVNTPAYKEVAVRIEKLGERGESPLHRNNFRFGNPTPRPGPEIERKWERDDYVPITEHAPHPERM